MEIKEVWDVVSPYVGPNLFGFAKGVISGTILGYIDSVHGEKNGDYGLTHNTVLKKLGCGAFVELASDYLELIFDKIYYGITDDAGAVLGLATGFKLGELAHKGTSKLFRSKKIEENCGLNNNSI